MAKSHDSPCELWQPDQTKLIEGRPVRFRDVCVHTFRIGDVEDPVLYAATPLWEWQQTDSGKFIMEHAEEKPYWTSSLNHLYSAYEYKIMARLSEHNEIFWKLKWGNENK
jgi:hypothetical protein